MKTQDKVCLFSGRFDPPHRGHIRTIQWLGQRFKKVVVVVLDYQEALWPTTYRLKVLEEILGDSKGAYEVISNAYHFGKISVDELLKFEFDVYAAGNPEVLKHIEKIIRTCPAAQAKGTLWVDRPYEVNATDERMGRTIRDMM